MNIDISSFWEALVLAVALSIDAFLAALSYGGQRIKVPASSVVTISIVSGVILLIALKFGGLITSVVGDSTARVFSFLVLLLLGLVRLFDTYLKRWIQKRRGGSRELKFSAFNLQFILRIYADPNEADADKSSTLSVKEAGALSLALSLDSIAAGVGAGAAGASTAISVVMFLLFTVLAFISGCSLGNKIVGKMPFDISWISGAMLILLAVTKLL